MRTTCAAAILIFISSATTAQIGGFLKQKADQVGQKSTNLLKGKASNKADADRDRLDSFDFNYAISVIDNSGMLNIRDKGEGLTKAAYAGSMLRRSARPRPRYVGDRVMAPCGNRRPRRGCRGLRSLDTRRASRVGDRAVACFLRRRAGLIEMQGPAADPASKQSNQSLQPTRKGTDELLH